MNYIHVSDWSLPERELKEIEWCSQVTNQAREDQVIKVSFGDNEVYLYPEDSENLVQIYALIDLTRYTGKICNISQEEFVQKYPGDSRK